jgi:hypothetical protein
LSKFNTAGYRSLWPTSEFWWLDTPKAFAYTPLVLTNLAVPIAKNIKWVRDLP